ncbi:CYB protein, partial [Oxylabes madagascariensis]|nr:CYB protein [Oxylabes madagascariensis]
SSIHLTFFHKSGSNNSIGIVSNCSKIPFHPYFSINTFTLISPSYMLYENHLFY